MTRKKSQIKKERTFYAVLRPENISDREFERLSHSPDFIKEILRSSLDSLPEIDITRASCSGRAVSNFFFRGVENNLYNSVTAKSFNKIFSPDSEKYAFEIPVYDRRDLNGVSLTDYQANMMRAADLAKEIAEKRGHSSGEYRDIALRILERSYS